MSSFPTGDRQVLSTADVYRVARQAGFSPAQAIIATAITNPESGRQPGVVQSGQPYSTTGWGLWQITPGNSVPSVGTDDALLDPLTNARAAYAKFQGAGNSFRPWTTYTDNAYQSYLSAAQTAASAVGDAIGGLVGGAEAAGAQAAGAAAGGSGGAGGGLGGSVDAPTLSAIQDFIGGGGWWQQGTVENPSTLPAIEAAIQAVLQSPTLPDSVKGAVIGVTGASDFLSGVVGSLGDLLKGLLWLTQPYNWVRLFAGIVGGISIVAGVVLVGKSG